MTDLAPPPYSPSRPTHISPAIDHLPLHILHRMFSLLLDPQATPSVWSGEYEEECVRRLWSLFRGVRPVCRRFYFVSTSILHSHYLPQYLTHLLPSHSTSLSLPTHSIDTHHPPISHILHQRSRETAVLDHFIAIMVGHQLRSTESSLTEEPDSLREIFVRLQPCARVEDLLSSLPSFLISVGQPFERSARRGVPLPVEYLTVGLTPSWCQVFLNTTEVGMTNERGRRGELVVEVRRGKGSEETVQRIGKGLGELRAGTVGWGDRVG